MKIRIWGLVLLVAVGSAAPAQSPTRVRSIIDVHVHVYADDPRWIVQAPNPVTGRPLSATSEQSHMLATLAEMERKNVVKAVVSNDYQVALRWKTAAPNGVIPVSSTGRYLDGSFMPIYGDW